MTTRGSFVGRVIVAAVMASVPALAPFQASAATVPTLTGSPCSMRELPTPNLPYYAIDMVKTGRVPGTGRSRGIGEASFARSPFGVSISSDGAYIYNLTIAFERLKAPKKGHYTVWVTTAAVDQVTRLGVLDDNDSASGRVAWNKYLVVLTLEPEDDAEATMWSGPIVSRGMSRSGMMHTMAGHGPYEGEPCAKYGFGMVNPLRSPRPQ